MNMRWWVNSDRKQFLSLSLSHTRTVKDSILPVNVYYEWILHYKHTKRGRDVGQYSEDINQENYVT